MSLQFTHVSSFACRGGLRKSRADCSAVLRNNTVSTNPRRFTLFCSSRRFVAWDCWTHTSWQVMQRDSDMLILSDSGKPRTFVLCEKKHEWVCSSASTSLKSPLPVRVWPIGLSVKLHLCRFLFMQYKITWLVRIRLCRLVEIRLDCLRFSSDIWVNTECKAIFAVASFHNSSGQFCKSCVVF